MGWKYVIVREGDREWPVIFPDRMVHSLMARALDYYFRSEVWALKGEAQYVDVQPVSAGEVSIVVEFADGGSETLNLASAKDDAQFMDQLPYNHGIRIPLTIPKRRKEGEE